MASQELKRNEIASIVSELDRTLPPALYDIGFLCGTIGNRNVSQKISGSFSGHALDIAIRAVVDKALLFVTRSWENNGNSIPRVIELLNGWGHQLEQERLQGFPEWPAEFLEIGQLEGKIQGIKRDAEHFRKKPSYLAVRLHRDEHIAHLLKGKSGLSRSLEIAGVEVDPATYDHVVDLATETAEIVDRIVQIWNFKDINFKASIKNSQKYTEVFWEAMPILSRVEKI